MSDDLAHIAFVSPNAAFSAFAESVLSSWPDIRVHSFADIDALIDARFCPSVIACNFEFDSGFYERFTPVLRDMRLKGAVSALAIVRRFDATARAACRSAGIDEVVVKPISPLHLGLRLAALTGEFDSGSARRSAEILPFPTRRGTAATGGFHPFAS